MQHHYALAGISVSAIECVNAAWCCKREIVQILSFFLAILSYTVFYRDKNRQFHQFLSFPISMFLVEGGISLSARQTYVTFYIWKNLLNMCDQSSHMLRRSLQTSFSASYTFEAGFQNFFVCTKIDILSFNFTLLFMVETKWKSKVKQPSGWLLFFWWAAFCVSKSWFIVLQHFQPVSCALNTIGFSRQKFC